MAIASFRPSPLLEALFFTSAIMVSAGLGFGLALRSAPAPTELIPSTSGGLLQSEQTFPPLPDWNPEPTAPNSADSPANGENPEGARYNSLQTQ